MLNNGIIVSYRCDVTWPEASPISREALLSGVVGKDAIFCSLVEKIDAEVLDSAGPNLKVIGTMSVGCVTCFYLIRVILFKLYASNYLDMIILTWPNASVEMCGLAIHQMS